MGTQTHLLDGLANGHEGKEKKRLSTGNRMADALRLSPAVLPRSDQSTTKAIQETHVMPLHLDGVTLQQVIDAACMKSGSLETKAIQRETWMDLARAAKKCKTAVLANATARVARLARLREGT